VNALSLPLFLIFQFVLGGGLVWLAVLNSMSLVALFLLIAYGLARADAQARRGLWLLCAPLAISLLLAALSGLLHGTMKRADAVWFYVIQGAFLATLIGVIAAAVWRLPRSLWLLATPIVVIELWFGLWAIFTSLMALQDTWL
jgi:hypothetical protein